MNASVWQFGLESGAGLRPGCCTSWAAGAFASPLARRRPGCGHPWLFVPCGDRRRTLSRKRPPPRSRRALDGVRFILRTRHARPRWSLDLVAVCWRARPRCCPCSRATVLTSGALGQRRCCALGAGCGEAVIVGAAAHGPPVQHAAWRPTLFLAVRARSARSTLGVRALSQLLLFARRTRRPRRQADMLEAWFIRSTLARCSPRPELRGRVGPSKARSSELQRARGVRVGHRRALSGRPFRAVAIGGILAMVAAAFCGLAVPAVRGSTASRTPRRSSRSPDRSPRRKRLRAVSREARISSAARG